LASTTEKPPANWAETGFDATGWKTGTSGFGQAETPGIRVKTPWTTPDIWLRTELSLDAEPAAMVLRYFHDEDMEVYVNGKPLLTAAEYVRQYVVRPLRPAEVERFRQGKNTVAVHCRQTRGGQGVDLGVRWVR